MVINKKQDIPEKRRNNKKRKNQNEADVFPDLTSKSETVENKTTEEVVESQKNKNKITKITNSFEQSVPGEPEVKPVETKKVEKSQVKKPNTNEKKPQQKTQVAETKQPEPELNRAEKKKLKREEKKAGKYILFNK